LNIKHAKIIFNIKREVTLTIGGKTMVAIPKKFTEQLIKWRRDFHQHPELGFLEMRTASKVAGILDDLGFSLAMGKEVMSAEHMMGKPSNAETKKHYKWAKENGANLKYIDNFAEGFTGIVATMKTDNPGPTIAFRVDMDALPIHESEDDDHFPSNEGFRSIKSNTMHACGHDAHTTIGLGLATLIAKNKESLAGTIKLIFQPAEEGTRGAYSMTEAGVVDDVDYFIATHIGTGIPHKHFLAAKNGYLATSKLNVTFSGVSAHAGGQPDQGKNALLAAASATLNLYAIARHSEGASRINVGQLQAGSGRNIIADEAKLVMETRGETTEINEYMLENAKAVIAGAAQMYSVDYNIDVVGQAMSSTCSPQLAEILHKVAEASPYMEKSTLKSDAPAGSEDATYFMNRVQELGGEATYCVVGTDLAAGHHHPQFDINEDSLLGAVHVLYCSILKINENVK